MAKEKITLDSVSSMRLYLPVIPAIFGGLLYAIPNGIYRDIYLGLTVVGILLVMLRLTVTFNSKTKNVVWKWGILFPLFPYKKKSFQEIAAIQKTKQSTSSTVRNTSTDLNYTSSDTYHRLHILFKKDNKKLFLYHSTNEKKVDKYRQQIIDILSIKMNKKPNYIKILKTKQ